MGAVRQLLTYREAAAFYRVSERTMRWWVQKGAVEVVRTPGGRPRVVAEGGSSGSNTIAEQDQDGKN